MSSLTETAYYTRRAINWTILGIIGYIILRIFWGLLIVIWFILFPPKAPPPNHAFGRLPAVKFPSQASGSAQHAYTLQTIEGSIPVSSASATVYFMPKSAANLLALSTTQDFATKLQFDPTPIQESKNIYRFNDVDFPLRTLRYDIVSSNFVIRYLFERDPSIFIEKDIPLSDAAKQQALDLLRSNELLHDDLSDGSVTVSYLRLMSNKLIPATSQSQSDAVRVDFFRKPIGDTNIVTPVPGEASISIIYSGASEMKKRIIQFAYTYWPVDYLTTATYPLKTSTQAWQELQLGRGYIASYPIGTSTAVVRNVYLAYYDSFEPQTYMQPIFVFEGDNGFVGYVPAVSSEWSD